MNSLLKRSLSGIVYVAVIVAACLVGGYWFSALTALFAIAGTIEYQQLVSARHGYPTPMALRACDLAGVFAMWGVAAFDVAGLERLKQAFIMIVICYFVVRFVLTLFDRTPGAIANLASSILGWVYVGFSMALLTWMNPMTATLRVLVLSMFTLIWLNDTGAFCVGSLIGKNKMCPRLSPKKSWEGFVGGMVFCIIAAVAYSWITNTNVFAPMLMAVGVSVFATWGDLFESLLKRSASVKDSGNLIPGHGGILDRIDSLLFVVPVIAFYDVLYKLTISIFV